MPGVSFGTYADAVNAPATQTPAPDPNAVASSVQLPNMAAPLSPTTNETIGNAIGYGLPGLGVGLLDTLGQSLHVINNNTIPEALGSLTGTAPNSFGDFYTRHQAALRAGGEIAGIMLPGKIMMDGLKTVNGLREAGSLGEWAKNATSLDVLLGSSADMAETEKAISASVTNAAADQGIWAGRTVATPEVIAAKRTYYAKKAIDAARTTIAFDLGNFAAFNSSQIFYPADTTFWDQTKWTGAGLAAGVGLEMAATRYAVRSMTQAAMKAFNAEPSALSVLAKDADKVMFRPNNRGIGVTAYAGMDADLNQTISVSNNPATLKTNLTQDMVNIKKTLSEQIGQMAYDTHEFLPRISLDQKQIDVGLTALKKNPTSLMFATKIANVPDNLTDFYADISKGLDKANTQYNTAMFAASNKFGVNTPDFYDAQRTALADLTPVEKAASEHHYVLEPTGDWTVYKNRADNYLDNNSFSAIKRKPYTSPNPANEDQPLKNTKLIAGNVILHDNGRLELPPTPTPMDFSTSYAMGSKLINDYKPVEGQQFIMTPALNWRTLEITSALAKANPEAAQSIKFGGVQLPIPRWKNLANLSPEDLQTLSKNAPSSDAIEDTGAVGDIPVSKQDASMVLREHQNYSSYSQDDLINTMRRTLYEQKNPNWINKVANNNNPLPEESAAFVRLGGAYNALKNQGYNFANLPTDLRINAINQYGNAADTTETLQVKLQNLFSQIGPKQIGSSGPPTQFHLYNTSQGFSSLDDVDFHVLNQKFQEFQKLMPSTATPPIAPPTSLLSKIGSLGKNYTPAQVLQRLNLPTQSGFADSPLIEMFAHAKLQGMDDLNEMFPKPNEGRAFEQPYTQLDLVKKHLQETAGVEDPTVQVPFQGNLLNQTSDAKPLFVAASAVPMTTMSDININARVQGMRNIQLQKLSQISPSQSPLVAGVMGKLLTTGNEGGDLAGAAGQARAVQTLQDGVLSGTGQLVYQDRINEQFPTLKALTLIAQDGDKYVHDYVEQLTKADLTPKFATILAPKNKADLLDFNRVEQAYRHGWDITGTEPSPTGNGFVFKLNPDSKINKSLLAQHFPDLDPEAAETDYMPDMSVTAKKSGYFPLQVSQTASDLANSISQLSIQSGVENNVLRASLGQVPITTRSFHLPTPELNKEGTWFVRNPVGRVIGTYTGPNFAQNEQRAKGAATTLGTGHIAVPLETVKADHQINDDNFFSLIDYSDQLAKTGAPIKGGLAHTEIDSGPSTLKAMIKSLQEQYLNIGIRSRAAVFEPELNYARQAAQTATVNTRDNFGNINIFDRYISTMFSQTPKGPSGPGALGKVYGGIESGLDKALSITYAHYASLSPLESNQIGAKIVNALVRKQSNISEYKQYAEQASDFSPFTDAEKFRESFFREQSPPTVRQLSGKLARLSSTMSLRLLDMGTAINNFAGLVTNMPSVVTALRKLPNETTDQWISRTGAWGTQLTDGIMTFSPGKAMGQAAKALWKGELSAPMMDAAKHGYFTPEYASLAQAMTLPEKPSQQAIEKFIQYASYGADRSEMLSRQWAWGMGYKIGKDLHQFDDERNSYIFANNFVNDMIGNYSPNNKPTMFQGAVGLPLGAFQTYMSNFYRRLYGYIERGDKSAILAQYAAQASVFGAKSVPGYGLWNSVFQSNDTSSDDFTSRVQRTFSPGVGELLLNGSLSNIPKIWGGMQGDGFAFYTRGSVDYTQPVPTLLDMSKAPPMQFLNDVFEGTKATIKNVFGAGGFSLQQQEEILANFSTNRALKSVMEMAAGVKTDQRGNVIDAGTRDAMHVAAAMMGTQLSSVRSNQEAVSRQRDVQLAQEDLQATLSAHTKSIIRSGSFTTEQLQGVVNNYINNGGNPAYIGQWFRNDLMNATEPKAQIQLNELAKSGKFLEFEDTLASMQQNAKNPQGANPQLKGTP